MLELVENKMIMIEVSRFEIINARENTYKLPVQ